MYSKLIIVNCSSKSKFLVFAQDGLRALLPNVNVSFGGNNPQQQQQQQQQHQFGLSSTNGLQNSFHNFGLQERMQSGSNSKRFLFRSRHIPLTVLSL
jgi:hypothetical protein